jgi:hypothetical protein
VGSAESAEFRAREAAAGLFAPGLRYEYAAGLYPF